MPNLRFIVRFFVWFNVRYVRRHPFRALAVVLGVALGAAVFTSVRMSVRASLASFEQSMDRVAGSADWTIARPGGRLDDRLISNVLRHARVRSAAPLLSVYVQARTGSGPGAELSEPFLLMGIDPILDRDLRTWQAAGDVKGSSEPAWADLIAQPGTLLISPGLQRRLGVSPGGALTLVHPARSALFQVLGVLEAQGLALVEGGRTAIVDIATFQEFLGLYGQVDRIDLIFKAGADSGAAAAEALRSDLPPDVLLSSPSNEKAGGRNMIRAYQFNLSFLSFVSLFVGMFLVYSLVALNAAARRRELAILRSLGASSGSLFVLFVGEGALLGILGWLAAMPISRFMTAYLLDAVSQTINTLFVRVSVDQLHVDAWEMVLSFAVTLMIATLAACQPAREAMQVPPREALSIETPSGGGRFGPGRLAVAGLVLMALVYPVSRLPSPQGLSLPGYAAALLLFGGFSLLAPFSLEKFGQRLAPLLAKVSHPAHLAARNLKESGMRSAISVGALITAVALFAALVIMIHSFRGTVALWVSQSIGGDLYVRPKMAELNRWRDPLPPAVTAALKQLEPPAYLVPIRRFELRAGTFGYSYEAIDYAAYERLSRFVWMGREPERIRSGFLAGSGVVVSQVFANRTGLRPGDTLQARIGDRVMQRPILGVFRDYRTQGGVVYDLLDVYQQQSGDRAWSAVQVNFSRRGEHLPSYKSRARRHLLACCGNGLEIIDGGDLRRRILEIFDQTFAITSILLLIALIVAGLGIATSMAIGVMQRTRQLNTLLAVGGSRRQIRAMIFWEAALIVLAGETAGLLCGFLLSRLLIDVINVQSFGWNFMYRIDWPALAVAMPLIFAAALAAVLPAVRLAFAQPPATLLRVR
jgi:putative ABC transport system permease protein